MVTFTYSWSGSVILLSQGTNFLINAYSAWFTFRLIVIDINVIYIIYIILIHHNKAVFDPNEKAMRRFYSVFLLVIPGLVILAHFHSIL